MQYEPKGALSGKQIAVHREVETAAREHSRQEVGEHFRSYRACAYVFLPLVNLLLLHILNMAKYLIKHDQNFTSNWINMGTVLAKRTELILC